jgi:hypothetical protein
MKVAFASVRSHFNCGMVSRRAGTSMKRTNEEPKPLPQQEQTKFCACPLRADCNQHETAATSSLGEIDFVMAPSGSNRLTACHLEDGAQDPTYIALRLLHSSHATKKISGETQPA